MKRNLSGYFVAIAITALSILTIGVSLEFADTAELGENPGYADQFFQMKQNENGEIPSGLWNQWRQERSSMQKAQFFSKVKEIGPSNIGGRARALIVDQANHNRLIAGGVSGGIWISENGGASWTPLDDEASTLSITSITQNPFNPKVIYYSTGERSSGAHINYDGNGVFKSNDGGLSFGMLDSSNIPAFTKTWDIVHSLTDSNTLYVGTIEFGLWRSTDAGKSFQQLFKSATDIHDVDVMADGTVYFTKEGSGLYRFVEGENPDIVHLKGNGLPETGFRRVMVAISPSDPGVLYVGMGGSDNASLLGMYKSTDTAKSWVKLTTRSRTNYNQIWHNFLLEIHPTDPNFVVMAGVTGEYSRNGGASFSAILNTHSDYHNAVYVPGTNDFFTVSDGGVYKYNKSTVGSSAVNGNGNFNITQLYAGDFFPDGDKVIIGAQDNWTTVNNSGGSVFSQWLGGDGAFNQVDATGEIIYASSQNGNIRRLANTSWVNIYNSLASKVGTQDFWFINPFELNPSDGKNIFFPTKNVVARSTNSGSVWSVFTKNIPGNIFSLGITDEANPTVYFGGQSGLLYRTNKANTAIPGDEFKMFTLGPIESRGGFIGNIEIDPNDETTIYLAQSNFSSLPRIWKVENADSDWPEWVDISSNLPESLPVNWIEVDPANSDHIMVATDYGLYVTANGGKWWQKDTRIPNVYVSMLRLRESDRKLFIFTFGRGAWVADLEENIVASSNKPEEKMVSIYPNPVSDMLTVRGMTKGDVALFDISGKSVLQESTENGTINISEIPAGTYFVRISESSGITRSSKVIIQR